MYRIVKWLVIKLKILMAPINFISKLFHYVLMGFLSVIYFIYSFIFIFIMIVIVGSFYLLFISLGMIVSLMENFMRKLHNLFNKITKNDSIDI